jgi:hypothetical protein
VLIYTKWTRNRMWFMLQPCNTWSFLLTYICLSRSELSFFLFNMYLHVMWVSCATVVVTHASTDPSQSTCCLQTTHLLSPDHP